MSVSSTMRTRAMSPPNLRGTLRGACRRKRERFRVGGGRFAYPGSRPSLPAPPPERRIASGVAREGAADRLCELASRGRGRDHLRVPAERQREPRRPLGARARHLDHGAAPLDPLHEDDTRPARRPRGGGRADADPHRLALRVGEQARAREVGLAGRVEPLVGHRAVADAVEPERERPAARRVEAVEVPVAEALGERPRLDDALGLLPARGRVMREADRAPLCDRALQPAEHRILRGGRPRVDPLHQLVEARAPVARHGVAERLDGALPPLPPERTRGGGEGGALALGEPGWTREALVERDVDPVALDVQVEEVVGREGRRADAEQEVEVLEQLLLAAAAAPRQLADRDSGMADRVRDEEQDAAEAIARIRLSLRAEGAHLRRGDARLRSAPAGRRRRDALLAGSPHASPRASAARTSRARSRSARGASTSARSPSASTWRRSPSELVASTSTVAPPPSSFTRARGPNDASTSTGSGTWTAYSHASRVASSPIENSRRGVKSGVRGAAAFTASDSMRAT